MARNRLRVFGAGVRGQVIADLVRWQFESTYQLDGFYDDNEQLIGADRCGVPILGPIKGGLADLVGSDIHAFFALGTYGSWRNVELLHSLRSNGVSIATLISPNAHVSPSARIGVGAFVMSGVFIGAEARIGILFGANAGSIVEHHALVGDNVLLGPGVAIAGSGKIGDHCFLGANCTVLPRIEVGAGTLVGSGSVISRNLPDGVIAIGAPARIRRPVCDTDEVPSPERIRKLPTQVDCH